MDLGAKEFEILLLEFCKQDLPTGFTVKHDVQIAGGESGSKRQIDVEITGRLGISEIVIYGEAKKWKRKLGNDTMDGIIGKYFSHESRANKVILYSNNGYVNEAISRAKKYGIDLLQPYKVGEPITKIPYVLSIGHLDGLSVTVTYDGKQENRMTNNQDYVFLIGKEKLSLIQFAHRKLISALDRQPLPIQIEVGEVKITASNILYELRGLEGLRYNGHFEITVHLRWEFISDLFPAALVHHVNSNKDFEVNLLGEDEEVVEHILNSPTAQFYNSRLTCIEFLQKSPSYIQLDCIANPEQDGFKPTLTLI